jgi:L-seryl-tRNA(Ser) seleniumtransferase
LTNERLRELPSIAKLLEHPAAAELLRRHPRGAMVAALREAVEGLRREVLAGGAGDPPAAWPTRLIEQAATSLHQGAAPRLRAVVNATGVVLHTNLGRALLAQEAVDAVTQVAAAYCNLELDLDDGKRGARSSHVEALLCELTGAEAACVVNNNAASMLLMLDEMARGGEVVVARSELIEIGGAFRLPDVLARSGARLVEVGTTNRCYVRDYQQSITPSTALLLKSHPSNYRIIGFTHEVTCTELAALGRSSGVPTAMDLGCGLLVDLSPWGLPTEPTAAACVASGLDVVCFSGDKLLGGPQAGILVGKASWIQRFNRNPLMRALRCDKMTLAALQATLMLYRDPDRLRDRVPALRMLTTPLHELEARARELEGLLRPVLGERVRRRVGMGLPGGGSLPGFELATWLVSIDFPSGGETAWAEQMRLCGHPVIARVEAGQVLLDVRTMLPADLDITVQACRQASAVLGGAR